MGYTIDSLPAQGYVEEYAAQFGQIPAEFVAQCDRLFQGKESPDFYLGLLTGYANAQNLVKQVELSSKSANTLGMMVCYIARKYLDMKSV